MKTRTGSGSTPSTDVTKIFEGAQGEIFVATEDEGLLIYDKFADQFQAYSPETEFNMERKDISSALIEENQIIWLGHKSGVISATDIKTNQSLSFQTEKNIRIAEYSKVNLELYSPPVPTAIFIATVKIKNLRLYTNQKTVSSCWII